MVDVDEGSERSDGAVPEISEAVMGSYSSSMSSAMMLEGMVVDWAVALLKGVGTIVRLDIGPLEEAFATPMRFLEAKRTS